MNTLLGLKNILCSIKNAYSQNSKYACCAVNTSNKYILIYLYKEGLISDVQYISNTEVKIILKYFKDKPFINNIELISKPSLKKFYTFNELNIYYKKYDIFFLSTDKSIISSNDINKFYKKKQKIGGELLFGIKLSK